MGLIAVSYAQSHCLDTTPRNAVVIVHVQEPVFLSAKHISKHHSTASTTDFVQHQKCELVYARISNTWCRMLCTRGVKWHSEAKLQTLCLSFILKPSLFI